MAFWPRTSAQKQFGAALRPAQAVSPLQQVRQLGEVDRHAARLILGQQVGGGASARLLLEIEIAERLPVLVTDDEAGVVGLVDSPITQRAPDAKILNRPRLTHKPLRQAVRQHSLSAATAGAVCTLGDSAIIVPLWRRINTQTKRERARNDAIRSPRRRAAGPTPE